MFFRELPYRKIRFALSRIFETLNFELVKNNTQFYLRLINNLKLDNINLQLIIGGSVLQLLQKSINIIRMIILFVSCRIFQVENCSENTQPQKCLLSNNSKIPAGYLRRLLVIVRWQFHNRTFSRTSYSNQIGPRVKNNLRSADVHRDKIIELERFKRGQQIHAHRKSKLGLGYPIIIRPFCSSVRPFSRRRRFEGSERGISGPKKGDRRKRLDWKALKKDKRMQVYPQNEVHKSLIF